MNRMNKSIFVILAAALPILLSGCGKWNFQMLSNIKGDIYSNWDKYEAGNFIYSAADVDEIEICWPMGSVDLVESGDAELSVSESGQNLDLDAQMRHYLDGRTLRIQFCQSGSSVHVKSADKALLVEIPKGIELSIHNAAADINAETLEQKTVFISSQSGDFVCGTLAAGSVELSSSSGEITIYRVKTDTLKLDTISGDMKIVNAISSDTLSCTSVSGKLDFDNVSADTVTIATTSGGIKIGALDCSDADLTTTSGRLRLALPENGAKLTFSTVSGDLKTSLPYEAVGDMRVFGNGGCWINVVSVSGDLEIQ